MRDGDSEDDDEGEPSNLKVFSLPKMFFFVAVVEVTTPPVCFLRKVSNHLPH